MHHIGNIMQGTDSIPTLQSHTSPSIQSNYPYPIRQNQASNFEIPLYASSISNGPLLPQQQHHHSCPSQSSSQTLSKEEWTLISSLRMMNNLCILPSFQMPSSTVAHQQTNHLATNQSCFDQTGHKIQLPSYATNTASILRTIIMNNGWSSTNNGFIRNRTPKLSSSSSVLIQSDHQKYQSTLQQQPHSSLTSPSKQSGHQNYSHIPQQYLRSPPTSPPPRQSGDQNYSPVLQKHSPSTSDSSLPLLLSPAQQTQQHPSIYPKVSPVFHYCSTITGPTVELVDQTKKYQLDDSIRVGGRILHSDELSMKYRCEDDMTISETPSGGHMLNMAGYSYFVKNYGKNFTTWECENRRKRRCSSILIRSSDPTVKNYFRIYSIQGTHIHEPAPNNIEIRKFKQRIKERCKQELSSPRSIYEDELKRGKYPSEMLAVLPTYYNMEAQLYRIRQEHLPESPTDPNFVLHTAFTTTDQGMRFLLYDSNNVQTPYTPAPCKVGRLIMYASDLQLEILSASKRISSDGTFESAPKITHQNYIIMGEYKEKHPIPLCFCLCERRNYETYELIIKVLKTAIRNLNLDFQPTYWMSDFEPALTKAIKKQVPNTHLLGCTFHYNQAIYRNIQLKGLQEAYQDVEVARQMLGQMMALAFVPSDQIKTLYRDFIKPQLTNIPKSAVSLHQNLRHFLKYYDSYWLTKIYKFCVFDQPVRTNNGLEGYNNKIKVQLVAHPHLYRLITWFEKEELLIQQLVMKLASNVPVHRRKRAPKTILIDESLQSLWDNYKAGALTSEALLFESSKSGHQIRHHFTLIITPLQHRFWSPVTLL
ncbi:unnamed protein product [Adineta ricciae]|uniref:MULE transposase domain-containing protein n=1 Tax=Adineta ricciae TaxID=249248 RepID=A0A814HXB1_ADIRI|nr:unnamed protein product [Adineta ricciae]CAF1339339.1 unnamed protein product [Adineta ricciae]